MRNAQVHQAFRNFINSFSEPAQPTAEQLRKWRAQKCVRIQVNAEANALGVSKCVRAAAVKSAFKALADGHSTAWAVYCGKQILHGRTHLIRAPRNNGPEVA